MPTYQDWGPEPFLVTTTKSINIAGTVPGYTDSINIKDIIGLYPQYGIFRLTITKENLNPEAPPFIVPFAFSGLIPVDENPATANYKVFEIEENGNVITFPIAFQNVNLLTPNLYRLRQRFVLEGYKFSLFGAGWKRISFIDHTTVLKIVDDLVLFEPQNIIIDHIIGSALKTSEVTLNGNIWTFIGNPKFTLSSTNPSVYIETVTDETGTYQKAFGNGIAVVKITLTSHFDIVGIEPYDYSLDNLLIMSAGAIVSFVTVRVKKFSDQLLSLTPEVINFSATKNADEATPKNLVLECNVIYSITASPWLIVTEENILVDSVPTQVIKVVPINSSNQDAGIYTGFVAVTASLNGVSTTKTTVVNYEIIDIAEFPYKPGELSFTLDNKQIKIKTYNADTYMQMDTVIETFDFYTDVPKEHTIREKIAVFQGKATVNIGKTIHQALSKAKEINENILQYIPANVKITFFENNLSDDATLRIDSSGNLKFIAGLSKDFQNFGFLKINHLPERVTIRSFKYLNYFAPAELHRLVIYKNGIIHSYQDLPPTNGKTATFKVAFDQFNQGDFIEYAIKKYGFTREDSFESSKIGFVIFPEGKYSNMLEWEDEFLLKQAIECTGGFNIKSNLSFISQKKYTNLIEHLTHLETNKSTKLTINTGWLLNTDVDMIESLMRSKKAWIKAKGKTIFLVPISESITNTDSERELIEFNLEFQINPTYNEETYRL